MDYSLFKDVLVFDRTYRKIRCNTQLVTFYGIKNHNQSIIFASAIIGNETKKLIVGFWRP